MNTENNLSAIDTTEINEKVTSLVNQVLEEPDVSKTKDLISLFNWNMSKKKIGRAHV